MSNFLQVTPFLHVGNLETAIAFFTKTLGFEATYREEGYAYLHRETVGFRLLEREDEEISPQAQRRFAYYIDVQDVDLLYSELKAKLDLLPQGDVHGPADKSYGQRELLVVAPDGNLIAFGQAIRK